MVLLDTWLLLARVDLRADEEALRRWSNAVGLVRRAAGVAVGDPTHPALQALVRWDQAGFAERESAERREAHLPPASRLATITGEPGAVDDALTLLAAPDGAEVLGPVDRRRGRRGAASWSGCPARRAPRCRARSASCSGSARPQARRRPHPGRPADPVRPTCSLD